MQPDETLNSSPTMLIISLTIANFLIIGVWETRSDVFAVLSSIFCTRCIGAQPTALLGHTTNIGGFR